MKQELRIKQLLVFLLFGLAAIGVFWFGLVNNASAAGSVIINEIFFNPAGSDTGKEFVELYNTSGTDYDLKNWALKLLDGTSLAKVGSTSSDQTIIPANGYLLIGLNSYDQSPAADIKRSASLPNSAKTVQLFDNLNSIIDSASYDTTVNEGQSWTRTGAQSPSPQNSGLSAGSNVNTSGNTNNSSSAANQNANTNSSVPNVNATTSANSANAVTVETGANLPSAPSAPIIGNANSSASLSIQDFSGLKINELLPDPEGNDQDSEFIELYNNSNNSMSLGGAALADTSGKIFTIPQGTVISAGGFKVFYRKETKLTLNNDSDKIVLKDPIGKEMSVVSYEKSQTGKSYGWNGKAWEWSDPTPGKNNMTAPSEPAVNSNANKPVKENAGASSNANKRTVFLGASINEVKNAKVKTLITASGTVTAAFGEISKNVFYIQDETGGIAVAFEGLSAPQLSRGDKVLVKGKLRTKDGEKQLLVEDAKNITAQESGAEALPWPMNIQDINEQALGLFVLLRGKVTDVNSSGFILNDGTGNIPAECSDVAPAHKSKEIEVQGIVKKKSGGLVLVTRDKNDFLSGKVLGASQKIDLSTNGKNNDTIVQLIIIGAAILVGGGIAYWYLKKSSYETPNPELIKDIEENRD